MASKKPPENHTPQGADADPLSPLRFELLSDLNDITRDQEEEASKAVTAHPSTFQLMVEVKQLARALAGVCRSHAAPCAQIHANCNENNPAGAAMKTLGLALCEHLELPPDTSLLMSELMTGAWPERNGVSRFVLEVADAPVDPNDFLRREMRLPRWGRKGPGGFGSRLGRSEGNRPQIEENVPFESVEETQRVLRGLEESFRNHLCDRWQTVFATASSAVAALASRASEISRKEAFLKHEEVGVNRAIIVEKIRREIVEIAEALELPEDYNTRVLGNRKFAKYTTVSVCNRHSDLKEKLCLIKTTNKPKIIEIACEIATRSEENRKTKPISRRTFQDAHKRYGYEAKQRLKPR